MTSNACSSLRIFCLALSLVIAPAQIAYQSGPRHSDTVPGAVAYDSMSETLYVTGAKYEQEQRPGGDVDTSCFVGRVSVPGLAWVGENSYGQPNVDERCTGLAFADAGSMILVGSTSDDEGDALKSGFVVNFEPTDYQMGQSDNSALAMKTQLPTPTSVAASGSNFVVASMVSKELSSIASDGLKEDTADATSVILPSYGAVIHKFSVDGNGIMVGHDWMEEIFDADGMDIFVGGMVIQNGALLLAGSTTSHLEGSSTDGFLAKLDIEAGKLLGMYKRHMTSTVISSACVDPNDSEFFYIAGTRTTSDGNSNPMIAKVHSSRFSFEWDISFNSVHPDNVKAAAYGMDCKVSGDIVYLAGTAKAGAQMEAAPETSAGMDDIFVAQVNVTDGASNWVHQVGSSGMDHLAHGGGLAVDADGNAYVYGSTDGSFFREKSDDYKDVFITMFAREDGSYASSVTGTNSNAQGTGAVFVEGGDGTTDGVSTGIESGPYTVEQSNSMGGFWASLLIPLTLVILFIGFMCFRDSQIRAAEAADQRRMMSIFKYVHAFDVEDIDIRRSPAGGYHGTYLNDLANGIVGNESDSSSYDDEDEDEDDEVDELEERFNRSQEFIEDLMFMEGSVKTRSPSNSERTPFGRSIDRGTDNNSSGPPSLVGIDDASTRTGTTSERADSRENASTSRSSTIGSSDHAPRRVMRSSSPDYSESTEQTERTEQSKTLSELV